MLRDMVCTVKVTLPPQLHQHAHVDGGIMELHHRISFLLLTNGRYCVDWKLQIRTIQIIGETVDIQNRVTSALYA